MSIKIPKENATQMKEELETVKAKLVRVEQENESLESQVRYNSTNRIVC